MSPPYYNIAGSIKSLSIRAYRMSPQASLPRPIIDRQKSAPPGGRRAGRIFAGKFSDEGNFSGGKPIIGHRLVVSHDGSKSNHIKHRMRDYG